MKGGAIVLAVILVAAIFFGGYYAGQRAAYDKGYAAGLDEGYGIGFDDGYWEVEGDLDFLIYRMEYAKDIHEQYFEMPPYPATGSHDWHEEWVDTYDQVIEVLEQAQSSKTSITSSSGP